MLILTLRTDNPQAEISLFENERELTHEIWTAHRELATTLHHKIAKLLQSIGKDWSNIEGIVVFKGPGSFTGLRIGAAAANALASSLNVPIIGSTYDKWQTEGITEILNGGNNILVLPVYGSDAHTTKPRA